MSLGMYWHLPLSAVGALPPTVVLSDYVKGMATWMEVSCSSNNPPQFCQHSWKGDEAVQAARVAIAWWKMQNPGSAGPPLDEKAFLPVVKAVENAWKVAVKDPGAFANVNWSALQGQNLAWVTSPDVAASFGSLRSVWEPPASETVAWGSSPGGVVNASPWDEDWNKPSPPFDKPEVWPKLPLDTPAWVAFVQAVGKAWANAGKEPGLPASQTEIAAVMAKLQKCPEKIPKDPKALQAFLDQLAKEPTQDPCGLVKPQTAEESCKKDGGVWDTQKGTCTMPGAPDEAACKAKGGVWDPASGTCMMKPGGAAPTGAGWPWYAWAGILGGVVGVGYLVWTRTGGGRGGLGEPQTNPIRPSLPLGPFDLSTRIGRRNHIRTLTYQGLRSEKVIRDWLRVGRIDQQEYVTLRDLIEHTPERLGEQRTEPHPLPRPPPPLPPRENPRRLRQAARRRSR